MATTQSTKTVPYPKRWSALFLLFAAQFMVIMDTSIIGVVLPVILTDLGYSQINLQWIFNTYVIFLGGLLLLDGKLSDLFGAPKIFIWWFAILSVASLFAGVAWSEAFLNIERALQGLGSKLIATAALTLVLSIFTDSDQLNIALGLHSTHSNGGLSIHLATAKNKRNPLFDIQEVCLFASKPSSYFFYPLQQFKIYKNEII